MGDISGADVNIVVDMTTMQPYTNATSQTIYPSVRQQQFPEREVGMFLLKYGLPVIIFTGTIGNILALIVLMRRRMRCTSICFYLAMLAIADTLVLYLSAFKTWIRMLTGFEVLHMSSAVCKGTLVILLISWHMSAWLIVAMTVDRFVAVWLPLRASIICNVSKAKLVSAVLFCSMIMINIHATWTMHLHTSPFKSCSPYHKDIFMVKVYPYLKLLSYSLIPFFTVLVLNMCIIFKLWRNRGIIDESHQQSQGTRISRRSQNRVTVMLLVVTFTWLVLTAPFMLWSLVTPNSENPKINAKIFLFKAFCFLLMYTNHSINFYIYCITGKRFRQELMDLFCRRETDSRNTWNASGQGLRNHTTRMSLTSIRSQKRNESIKVRQLQPMLNGSTQV